MRPDAESFENTNQSAAQSARPARRLHKLPVRLDISGIDEAVDVRSGGQVIGATWRSV
jgi:hypothetical protein